MNSSKSMGHFSIFLYHLQFLLEKATATHSSTLAWKIPWMEEPGRLQSMGLLSRARLRDFTFTFHFHALEKEMATHSSILAWRIPGTEEPRGLSSMGSHRVGHDWSDLAAAAVSFINVLYFSAYRSFTSLVRFIPKFFWCDFKRDFFFLSLSDISLLVQRNATDFCMLIFILSCYLAEFIYQF